MKEIVRKITVDLARKGNVRLIFARQNDKNSRKIVIHLTDGGIPYLVSKNMSAIVNFARSDGTSGAFAANIESDGSVSITLGVWPLAVAGEVICSVSIFDGEERKLTSSDFYLDVESELYTSDEITADESYSLLTGLIADMVKINDAEAQRVAAEEQRKTAEDDRVSAEAQRFSAEEQRAASEESRATAFEQMNEATERANEICQTIENKLAAGEFNGVDGKDGIDGADGNDGYTPVRGVDYWTEADIAAIKAYIDKKLAEAVGGGNGDDNEESLTPSEGLLFYEYYNALPTGEYFLAGIGTCTDTVIVVPSTTSDGYPVTRVGATRLVVDHAENATVWIDNDITKIYLPDSVIAIGFSGFLGGSNLEYIKFSKNLETVGEYLFTDGGLNKNVVFDFSDYARSEPPTLVDTEFVRFGTGIGEIRVPSAMVDAWKTAQYWSVAADKIVGV